MHTIKAALVSGTTKPALRRRITAVLMMAAILVTIFALPAFAQNTYVITDGPNVIVHTTSSTDMREIISEAGLDLGESDTYTTQETDGVSEIIINRVKMVSVNDGGQLSVIGSYGGTVANILETLQISLDKNDRISHTLETEVYDGMEVTITRVRYETVEYEKSIPYETMQFESSALSNGEQQTLVAGSDGLMQVNAKIIYENGEEVGRSILDTQIITPAVNAITLYGVDRSVKEQEGRGIEPVVVAGTGSSSNSTTTLSAPATSSESKQSTTPETATITPSEEGGVITTASGTTLSYTKALSCNATAYTCEGYTGYTYSGTVARVGAIAVDPNFIPLGTEMYIVADDGYCVYGYCVAEDTGGLIKGNRVDLYFDTYNECINFGYRPVTVYILE